MTFPSFNLKKHYKVAKLYLICGFLGAGKTTYSKKLADITGALYLNPDDWCMQLFSKEEYEQHWEQCFAQTIEFLWDKIKEVSKHHQDVIFDMGFWTKASREEARNRAIQFEMEPILYYIYAPDDILKQRISRRTGAIAQKNYQQFEQIKSAFEAPQSDEPHILVKNF